MNEDRDISRNVKQWCQGKIGKENAIFRKCIKKKLKESYFRCMSSLVCVQNTGDKETLFQGSGGGLGLWGG